MKTIILATDFSPAAGQAARFAGQLAHDQEARLLLVNAYQVWPDNGAKTGNFPLSVEATQESSEKNLRLLANHLREEIGSALSIEWLAKEGHTMNTIRSVSTTERADLLVMSTVGTAPQSAQLMGSIATEMVAETEVPLLLIPPGVNYHGLKNVVLGIDLTVPPNALVMDTVLRVARSFGSILNVLCISNKLEDTQQQAEHIRHLLNQQPHTLTIETGDDINEALLDFAHTNRADLIMMLPQVHNWLVKLFSEGETQRMARLSDIPLLAVV